MARSITIKTTDTNPGPSHIVAQYPFTIKIQFDELIDFTALNKSTFINAFNQNSEGITISGSANNISHEIPTTGPNSGDSLITFTEARISPSERYSEKKIILDLSVVEKLANKTDIDQGEIIQYDTTAKKWILRGSLKEFPTITNIASVTALDATATATHAVNAVVVLTATRAAEPNGINGDVFISNGTSWTNSGNLESLTNINTIADISIRGDTTLGDTEINNVHIFSIDVNSGLSNVVIKSPLLGNLESSDFDIFQSTTFTMYANTIQAFNLEPLFSNPVQEVDPFGVTLPGSSYTKPDWISISSNRLVCSPDQIDGGTNNTGDKIIPLIGTNKAKAVKTKILLRVDSAELTAV